jgi:hypothetical protein
LKIEYALSSGCSFKCSANPKLIPARKMQDIIGTKFSVVAYSTIPIKFLKSMWGTIQIKIRISPIIDNINPE